MGADDDFTRRVVALAAAMGIECVCKKMRRPGFVDDVDYYEPFDEYEARSRASKRLIILDEGLALLAPSISEPLIKKELEHLR